MKVVLLVVLLLSYIAASSVIKTCVCEESQDVLACGSAGDHIWSWAPCWQFFPPLPQALLPLLALQIELSDSARLTGRNQGLATHGCFEQSPVRLIWQPLPCGRRGEAAVAARLSAVSSSGACGFTHAYGRASATRRYRGGAPQATTWCAIIQGTGGQLAKPHACPHSTPPTPTPLFLEGQKAPL